MSLRNQPSPNHCVQATPDRALLFIVAQVSAAPDAERSAGAGVESVVAVDFRNRMTDGVLKQQC
jgi:hypothetical protein